MEVSKKALIIIQDGLGDRPTASLQNRTPLEAAVTPCMDTLASSGRTGSMRIVGSNGRVGTDIGHCAWFGQDPKKNGFARGPVEAAGVGVELKPGQIALRFNFATLDGSNRILDRRAGRIREGTRQLTQELNRRVGVDHFESRFYPATEHRGVLVLTGPELSTSVSDSDPGGGRGDRLEKVHPLDDRSSSRATAAALNSIIEQARVVLPDHPVNQVRRKSQQPPANAILTRSAGRSASFRNMARESKLHITVVSGESTVIGIARLAGLRVLTSPLFTANLDTDLEAKMQVTEKAVLESHLTFLHIKGCDIAGHNGDCASKKSFIERTDRALSRLLHRLREQGTDLIVGLVADHATPCGLREHSNDPFPVVLVHPSLRADSVRHYGERSCQKGSLTGLESQDYLQLVLSEISPAVSRLDQGSMHNSTRSNR